MTVLLYYVHKNCICFYSCPRGSGKYRLLDECLGNF